jgi:phosphatidylserine/phosphatidylglycerophosphate/cardiolipin synthase-like enzyme
MRKRVKQKDLSLNAIAGTYVVLLGINIASKSQLLEGLLGFAINRIDHAAKKKPGGEWLKGYLTFETTRKRKQDFGELVSSLKYPIQEFLWGDYTVKPNQQYTYRVVPMYGQPGALQQGRAIEINVTTESESDSKHAVYFNRGVAGSQAYARRFENKRPDKVPNREAFRWLSRGLEEAIIAFIGQAKNRTWSLRASIYEFQHASILEAFKAARDRGVNIRIVFDYKMGANKPARKNWSAIKRAGIEDLVTKRTQNKSHISHNKFIVLLKHGKPVEVWTGSTNITTGGIFGHSNVGHIVRDQATAKAFYEYWQQVSTDPPAKEFRIWNEEHTPLPTPRTRASIYTIFSPRSKGEALEYYTKIMDDAKNGVFLTAAFGVNKLFQAVLERNKNYLRYLLLETAGSNLRVVKRTVNNQIAVGSLIGNEEGAVANWLKAEYRGERLAGLNEHVAYIHTKYMLIDPLSRNPTVITGSANFSTASTINNDENMLIIRGDTRVTDIYLTEFMRLFSHFRRRGLAAMARSRKQEKKFLYLCPDDTWTEPFYKTGSSQMSERLLFS